MREIKFRCWNNNQMLYWDFDSAHEIFIQLNSFPIPFQPLMQYIGLKDKNGKEIYEGDIVNIEISKNIFEIFKIEYRAPEFILTDNNNFYRDRPERLQGYNGFTLGSCEVLGNVYENQDILEKQ